LHEIEVDRVLIAFLKEHSNGWQHAVNAKQELNQNLLNELHLVQLGDENWLSRSSVRYHVQGEHFSERSTEVECRFLQDLRPKDVETIDELIDQNFTLIADEFSYNTTKEMLSNR
jgi:hypothetical protein